MRARLFIAGLSIALGCAACGFKGPLYLPGRSGAVVTHPAPAGGSAPDGSHPPAKPTRKNGRTGTAQGSSGTG